MRYIKTKDGKIYDMNECVKKTIPVYPDPDRGTICEFEDGAEVNEHDIVAQADTIEELCKIPMSGSEALEIIKAIELSHVEHEQDEDIDGEWVYTDDEVYDGTVAENYPYETKVLEKHLKALDIASKKNVNIGMLKRSESVGSYHYKMDELRDKCKPLTQEEFDLLKEVLK